MCAHHHHHAQKNRPVDTSRLVRPQSRLDLILDLDELTGRADVRSSMILDITGEHIVAAQTDPPVMKSAVDRAVEATVIYHDLVGGEFSRWGWSSRILGLNNQYRLNAKDPNSAEIQVIFLVPPPKTGLTRTNIRQFYRLEAAGPGGRTVLTLKPDLGQVSLLNFSAGGLMMSTPVPSAFALGQDLRFTLTFPGEGGAADATVSGQAFVVRQEYEPGDRLARLGLKFMNLSASDARTMQKIIQRLMLEEQRLRNRDY